MSKPRSIRFPNDLEHTIENEARVLDRSFSWVVINRLRTSLFVDDTPPANSQPVSNHDRLNAIGSP